MDVFSVRPRASGDRAVLSGMLHWIPACAGTNGNCCTLRPPNQFNFQTAKSNRHAPSPVLFVEAPGKPVFPCFPRKREGDGAPGGATIVLVMPHSLSKMRTPPGAPSRASSLQRRAALCGAAQASQPTVSHAPGRQPVLAAGRSPGAARVREERSSPARGRRILLRHQDASS